MKKKTIMQYPLNAGRVAAVVFALGGLSILYFYVLGSMNASHAPTRVMVPATTVDTELTTSKSTKSYQSASLNIAFEYPGEYSVENQLNVVRLISQDGGEISIIKSGSIFNDIKEHVNRMVELNKLVTNSVEYFYQPYQGAKLVIDNAEEKYRSYIFLDDYQVYIFSTEKPALFSDLDSIARSFQIAE
jgi:hypothetical protein